MQKVFGQFSCVMGHIWRARRKKTAAYFSDKQFGCPGGVFFLGFNKPQTETIIHWETARKKSCGAKKPRVKFLTLNDHQIFSFNQSEIC